MGRCEDKSPEAREYIPRLQSRPISSNLVEIVLHFHIISTISIYFELIFQLKRRVKCILLLRCRLSISSQDIWRCLDGGAWSSSVQQIKFLLEGTNSICLLPTPVRIHHNYVITPEYT